MSNLSFYVIVLFYIRMTYILCLLIRLKTISCRSYFNTSINTSFSISYLLCMNQWMNLLLLLEKLTIILSWFLNCLSCFMDYFRFGFNNVDRILSILTPSHNVIFECPRIVIILNAGEDSLNNNNRFCASNFSKFSVNFN